MDMDLSEFKGWEVEEILGMLPEPPVGSPGGMMEHDPSAEGDPEEFLPLMIRACKGLRSIAMKEQQELFAWMLRVRPEMAVDLQTRAHEDIAAKHALSSSKKVSIVKYMSKDPPTLAFSKHTLDFGLDGGLCPLVRTQTDVLTITNKGNKFKFNFVLPPPTRFYTITAEPKEGVVKKKQTVDIEFKITVHTTSNVSEVVIVEIEQRLRHFLLISFASEESQFGVDPNSQEVVEDLGYTVPRVLKQMREAMVEMDGFKEPNIFQLSGEDDDIRDAREALNKGTFTGVSSPLILSSLIKLWYRELPTLVLNHLTQDVYLDCNTKLQAIDVLDEFEETYRNILLWLMDVLVEVIRNKEDNNMSAKLLSIMLSPNLFQASNTDPLESLTLSQKVVTFVNNILDYRYENLVN